METIWLEAIAVAAFVALVAGILLWLRSADRKLAKLLMAAEAMERHAAVAKEQVCELLDPMTATMRNVQKQLEGVSRLTDATRRIGDSASQLSLTVSRLTAELNDTVERHAAKSGDKLRHQITDAMDWAEVGYAVWQLWQTKRKDNRASACSGHDLGQDTTI
ncbi:DUF948 domain-containing protein [Paenibacillus sp. OV219]|uniref:DUF948 domain-containing protein n=1 Tax=Paenibacillus sp. OV219 TaxID=1884377 RepID=UPI0008D6EDB3|nr:DUF948 domain-containing protein [Paenibacillus sp. OV219]SEM65112.1 Uncharacterized protein YoxC, contains an MCP-like domain [Paenibacillus sp. OV219]